jgi:hypothetical protein
VTADVGEVHAWAIMGMNVFIGLRYGVWDDVEDRPRADVEDIARAANRLLTHGLLPHP